MLRVALHVAGFNTLGRSDEFVTDRKSQNFNTGNIRGDKVV
jgi:hypothetical protein